MLIIVVALATVSVPLALVAYSKIRPYFSVTVKCWFCGEKTVVPYGNINCWDCPQCEQYNGFREDGDYNKPIPSQYDESLNFTCTSSQSDSCSELHLEPENGLCPTCNYNQLVKVRLLANFTPLKEESYDSEVDAYKAHLERVYGMCHECSLYVQRRLTEQDSFLWPQLRDFWLASGSLLQACSTQGQLTFIVMLMTGFLSSIVASLLVLVLLQIKDIGIASPFLMHVSGTALSLGSLLLSGREEFGPVDLLLCWFWFVSHLLNVPFLSLAMQEEQLQRLQALVIGAAVVFAVARIGLCVVQFKRKKNWAFRKLPARSCLPSDEPVLSGKCTLGRPTDSESVRSSTESARSLRRAETKSTEKKPALHDMMEGFHISPESAKRYSPQSDTSSQSFRLSRTTAEKDEASTRLLWPPKLHLSSTSGSWMVGGTWAVGGGLSRGTPLIDWGVKQTYGVLTPPPSQTGSMASFYTASPPRRTAFESFQSFGNSEHAKSNWLNLKSQAERQNFYSATKKKPLLGCGGASAFTPISPHKGSWSSRSLCNGHHLSVPEPMHRQRSSCVGDIPLQRSYAHSSVSQDSHAEQSKVVSSSTSVHQGRLNEPGRFLWWSLFTSLSVITNVLLFAYFIFVPTARPTWLCWFLDKLV